MLYSSHFEPVFSECLVCKTVLSACVCVQFVKEVVHVVDSQDTVMPPELRTDSRAREDHQVWCEKTWKHVIPTLEYWALTLRQLKVAYFASCINCYCTCSLPSVLWHCRFGLRKNIRPIKIEWWGADMVIWLERDAGMTAACLIFCTRGCTVWMFLSQCRSSSAQLSPSVCSPELHSTWWSAAFHYPVLHIYNLLAATSCLYLATGIRCSVFRPSLFSVALLMTWNLLPNTAHDATCSFDSFRHDIETFLFSVY